MRLRLCSAGAEVFGERCPYCERAVFRCSAWDGSDPHRDLIPGSTRRVRLVGQTLCGRTGGRRQFARAAQLQQRPDRPGRIRGCPTVRASRQGNGIGCGAVEPSGFGRPPVRRCLFELCMDALFCPWWHTRSKPTEEPVAEAELLENFGEFAGRTDQGDRMPALMTKQAPRLSAPPLTVTVALDSASWADPADRSPACGPCGPPPLARPGRSPRPPRSPAAASRLPRCPKDARRPPPPRH